jgi:hypothetical protein
MDLISVIVATAIVAAAMIGMAICAGLAIK